MTGINNEGHLAEWMDKMDHYAPEVLEAYKRLNELVLRNGALSRKEKECILVGINAARRYEKSMLYHTKCAIDVGASLDELAEILSVCILSRGLPAWLEGMKALAYAAKYIDETRAPKVLSKHNGQKPNRYSFESLDDCIHYYDNMFGTLPQWAKVLLDYSPDTLLHYTNLRNANLSDGRVSRKLKELVLVGINTAERYPEGVRIHTEGARSCGATEMEIAECHLTAVLTAGIPAWFEGAQFLKKE